MFLKALHKKQKFYLKNMNWTFKVSFGPHFAVAKQILIKGNYILTTMRVVESGSPLLGLNWYSFDHVKVSAKPFWGIPTG